MTFMAAKSDGDFGRKLVIKAQLGDDLRRILIHNEELTYDELILMMQRVFKPKLDHLDSFIIKYKDEDDEYITIAEEFDLSYAIHQYKVLRLKILTSPTTDGFSEEITPAINNASSDADVKNLLFEVKRLHEELSSLTSKFNDFVENFKKESCSARSDGAPTPSSEDLKKPVPESRLPPCLNENSLRAKSDSPKPLESTLPPFSQPVNKPFSSLPNDQSRLQQQQQLPLPQNSWSSSSQQGSFAPFDPTSSSSGGQVPPPPPQPTTAVSSTAGNSSFAPPPPLMQQQQQQQPPVSSAAPGSNSFASPPPPLLPTSNMPPPPLQQQPPAFQPGGGNRYPPFAFTPSSHPNQQPPPPPPPQQPQSSILPPPLGMPRPISAAANPPPPGQQQQQQPQQQPGMGQFPTGPMPPPMSSPGGGIMPPPPMSLMSGGCYSFGSSSVPPPPMPPPQPQPNRMGVPPPPPALLQLGGPPQSNFGGAYDSQRPM